MHIVNKIKFNKAKGGKNRKRHTTNYSNTFIAVAEDYTKSYCWGVHSDQDEESLQQIKARH